jgi:hypothetical protein
MSPALKPKIESGRQELRNGRHFHLFLLLLSSFPD